jgi:NDP-mannose synthase
MTTPHTQPHRAVILAGGQGTRLRPYTTVLPKALMPVADVPVLEHILHQLKATGFGHVTLAVGHLASLVQACIGDGRRFGLTIDYVQEHVPLGTAGPLRLLHAQLPPHVLVMNADVLCNVPFDQLMATHQQSGAIVTVATYHRKTQIPFGVLNLNGNHITGFTEKPHISHQVSMGVYAVSQHITRYITPNTLFGFDHLLASLLADNQPVKAFPFDGYWMDMGCVAHYEQVQEDMAKNPTLLHPWQAAAPTMGLGLQ